jgi:hypothetical protein
MVDSGRHTSAGNDLVAGCANKTALINVLINGEIVIGTDSLNRLQFERSVSIAFVTTNAEISVSSSANHMSPYRFFRFASSTFRA